MISTKLLAGRTVVHVYSDDVAGRGLRARRAGPRGRLLQHDGGPHRPASRATRSRSLEARRRMKFLGDLPLRVRLPGSPCLDLALFRGPCFDAHLSDVGDGEIIMIDDARRRRLSSSTSPFVIAVMTVLGSLMGLLMAGAVAGDAAARDVQTRMDPLIYTAPVSKAEYLRRAIPRGLRPLRGDPARRAGGLLLAVVVPGRRPSSSVRSVRLHLAAYVVTRAAERLRRDGVPVLDGGAGTARHGELPRRVCSSLSVGRLQPGVRGWSSFSSGNWRSCWIPSASSVSSASFRGYGRRSKRARV